MTTAGQLVGLLRQLAAALAILVIGGMISADCGGAPPSPQALQTTEWARDPLLADPVALAFDRQGRLYVVETARRSSVDIDIRAHRSWLLEDLANQRIADTREFFRRRMAPERSAENRRWLTDRNRDGVHDWRDLTTVSERIRRLEDTDGDGRADRSVIYADGFQEEFTGVAAGVLPVGEDVLFTVYPDLWRLRDLDGDGQADQRSIEFRGFGVHAAFDGHDLHGLTVGPEGKIYFSCGDNGFSVTTREGRTLHYPNTGGVLRMNPDGSELEVFATGLRNVQEFDFDRYGNMFAVDNDGDLGDERERAVYIAEGSDSGWRVNWQFRAPGWREFNGGMTYNPWTADGMWKPQHAGQPAYITPPMQNYSVGPGGFKFNPGTALNAEYRDFFFCVQFPVQQITAFRTEPRGAGFQLVDEHLFHGGLMASSVNFGPDGALYIADWLGMWEPNGAGVIYRVDDPAISGSSVRRQVQRLLAEGLESATAEELADKLGHPDRRIRQLAQFEMVRRGMSDRLLEIATMTTANQLARIHALWGLIQCGRGHVAAEQLPWSDADPQIRQQCARVAGDLRLPSAQEQLIYLLRDSAPLVESFAAVALGKVAARTAVVPLLDLLERNADRDPFLRHAAALGLAGCATGEELGALSSHESPSVRMGAVLALRRLGSPHVARFFADSSQAVRREAVYAAHDDFSIPAALPAVARLLEGRLADEGLARRAISANLRLGTPDAAERLLDFVLRKDEQAATAVSKTLRAEALTSLSVWGNAPLVDRVEGRIRELSDRDRALGKSLLAANFESILQTEIPGIVSAALQSARQLGIQIRPELLVGLAAAGEHSMATRTRALRLLADSESGLLTGAIEDALRSEDLQLQQAGLEIMADRDPESVAQRIAAAFDAAPLPQRRLFVSMLAELETPSAVQLLDRQLAELLAASGPRELALDVVGAVQRRGEPQQLSRLRRWRESVDRQRFGLYQYSLSGGDPARGEQLYLTHVSAQCARCHQAGGQGKQAGPDLKGLAAKVPREYLLEALVDPSAQIAKGFESVVLLLADGRSVTGTIIDENSDRLVLATPQGEMREIASNEIEDRVASQVSAMPPMIDVLDPAEVRDVVAYLATLQ